MKHTNTVFYQLLRFIPKHRFDDAVKRHQGLDVEILEKRKKLYQRKRNKHPERWSGNA